jgi:hypothetical protein
MAVTAMTGEVSWAPQNYKSTHGSYTQPTDGDFYRHKATLVDLAVLDDTRLGAPEVGGNPVPTFPYKAGVLVGGGMTIQPRLESTLGWLLYGIMGDVTSSAVGTTTEYSHTFDFAADPAETKWFSFRKHIPRKDGAATTDLGEQYEDCKIVSMSFNLANDAPITSRIDALGRTFFLDEDPSTWTYANTFEDFQSIPIGCNTSGYLKLPGYSATELPIVAATVTMQNIPLDVRQERVFGDPYIEDVTTIMRQLTFDMVAKWNDPDLYQSVLTGSTTGTQWTVNPYTTDLEIFVTSPDNLPGLTNPYALTISASKVMVAQTEGITLAGNQAIMTRFTGTAIEDPGNPYAEFQLNNQVTQYSWPT